MMGWMCGYCTPRKLVHPSPECAVLSARRVELNDSLVDGEDDRYAPPLVYVMGSLRNPEVPLVANELRDCGLRVFDDWYAAGPEADDYWQAYERDRSRSYVEALAGAHAQDVYEFDRRHLDESQAAVLVAPAGKSAHLELGYVIGQGKPGFILLEEEPERYDVMYNFATAVVTDVNDLADAIWRSL